MVPEVIFVDCTIKKLRFCETQLIVQRLKSPQEIPIPTPIVRLLAVHIEKLPRLPCDRTENVTIIIGRQCALIGRYLHSEAGQQHVTK